MFPKQLGNSLLFITLDSCRFDTFESANLPVMKSVGSLNKAMAPSYFTFGSHMAMFMGFTPGIADRQESFLNPKYGKIFKLTGGNFGSQGKSRFSLTGRNIIDGFKRQGYDCIGTGAVQWFNPETDTGRVLTEDFDEFYYPGDTHSLPKQLSWLENQLDSKPKPVFIFLNIGETHVPYYHQGAPWNLTDNPCRPFKKDNNAAECRRRQQACLQYADPLLEPLLKAFDGSNIIICGDHGDCWGEDDLWEHGFSHLKTLEVPLLLKINKPRNSFPYKLLGAISP